MKDKIEKLLKEANIKFEFIKLPEDLALDVESHMKFHGHPMRYAMPNIVFKTEKGFIVAQRRSDTKVDSKKLKKLAGVHDLRIANEDELKCLGLIPGIVPPVGFDVRFFMDQRIFENKFVFTGTGDKLYALKLNPRDIEKVNKPIIGNFTEIVSEVYKRVFSGTRATGRLHLGNYLGAIKGYLELSNAEEYETIYMVMDLHAITTPFDKEKLAQNTKDVIMDYLACGLDPEKSIITAQSLVPEHTYLAQLLSSEITVARMQHLPTFKDKIKQYPKAVTMALLNYPVLMAADILLYKASLVPVGIDQEPHLEVAREIARKMNEKYGTDFPEPRRFSTKGEYVPSLSGEGKMSKSVEGSYINLVDGLKTIKKRLASAPTDSGKGDKVPKEGGVANLLKFVELFEGEEKRKKYENGYVGDGIRYGELKAELAEAIFNELKPIQERRRIYENNPSLVDRIISEGAQKAQKIAKETIKEVKEKIGLI